MSNRIFKIKLNNQQSIMFDYGEKQQLPDLTNLQQQQAAICCVNGVYYIKQRYKNTWDTFFSSNILRNVFWGQDIQSEAYQWVSNFVKDQNGNYQKIATKNNILIWNHGQNNLDVVINFTCQYNYNTTQQSDSSQSSSTISYNSTQNRYFSKCFLPYIVLDENNVAIDFTGFEDKLINIVI